MVHSTPAAARLPEPGSPATLAHWHGRLVAIEHTAGFLAALRTEIVADWIGLMEADRVVAVATSPRNARAIPALATCPHWTEGTLDHDPSFHWSVPGSRTGEHWIAVRVTPFSASDQSPVRWLLAIWKYRDSRRSRAMGQVSLISGVVCLDQSNPAQDLVPSTDPAFALLLWATTRLTPVATPDSPAPQPVSLHTAKEAETALDLAGDLAALLELTGFLQAAPSLPVAIQLLAGHLRGYLGAESVWVSLHHHGDRPLVANHDGPVSTPAPPLVAACEETRLRETPAAIPEESPQDRIGSLALRTLARDEQRPQLLSTPWPLPATESTAVIIIAWSETSPDRLAHARRFLDAAATPIASALALQALAHEPLLKRWTRRFHTARRSRPLATTLMVAAVAALLLLLPVPDPVPARTQLEPLRRRLVAAPFEARLAETLVRPGDVVAAGQPLARLDERDLRGELDQLAAAIHKAATERDGHLSQHEQGLAELDRLEIQRLTARHDLVEKRLRQLDVVSPIAGLVVTGELDQALGAPVKTGEMLFEIAPLDTLRAELLVTESDRALIRPEQSVSVHLDSLPSETFTGTIRRIRPRAETRDDEYGFVAELELTDPTGRLRPGMRGLAHIEQPWRPLAVRLFRRTWQTWQARFGL